MRHRGKVHIVATDGDERRRAVRRRAEASGEVRFGEEAFACRVLDVSDVGAQIRIEGRRASRSLVGKRASLAIASADARREARVVWARPAVAGVYLGLAFADRGQA